MYCHQEKNMELFMLLAEFKLSLKETLYCYSNVTGTGCGYNKKLL